MDSTGKSQHIWLIVYVLLVTLVTASSKDHQRRLPTCITESSIVDTPPLFARNGTDLKTNRRKFQISTRQSTECEINLSNIVASFNFSNGSLVGYFDLQCVNTLRLHVVPYDRPTMPSMIQYIKITGCSISVKDLNSIAGVGKTNVLFLLQSPLEESNNLGNQSECPNLHGLSSLGVNGVDNDNSSGFEELFNCMPVFEKLAEVTFSNIWLNSLPNRLKTKFPNLQAMDIPNNKFTSPPLSFPWTKSVFNLPGDISRSEFLQYHYVVSEFLDIPENIFRRTYRLDDNLIRNLSGVSFQGYLHYFSMQRNELVEIGEDTFTNVTGLQYISLAENELETIPCFTFSSLNELTNMDLSKNKLNVLCKNTFQDLKELKRLNLANNSLTSLSQGLFINLNKLEVLHLEFNELIEVSPMSFPLNSVHFKEIRLFNNPIERLPEFVFWIRSLRKIDLHHTNISLGNITHFLETMNVRRVTESVLKSLSYIGYIGTANKPKDTLRLVDLSNAKITGFNFESNVSVEIIYRIKLLLLNFKFIFDGNPLNCDCNILPVSRFINGLLLNENIDIDIFINWLCMKPRELKGRSLIHVRPEETYCPIEVPKCPTECECFKREVNDHIIVDCRNKNLSIIHHELPEGPLELWYSENIISKLIPNQNFLRIVVLDVSYNQIVFIDPRVAQQLINTKHILLHSNLLAVLPQGFNDLSLTKLTLDPNPFSCDCNTLWMKDWLIREIQAISDITKITCFSRNEDGNVFINVPDDQFVCEEVEKIDTLKHVVLPSVVSTSIAIMFLALSVVIYAYRQECKVLIFVYTGWHPFDRDYTEQFEHIDCIVVHSGKQTNWVIENIVQLLENENLDYKICDMARDFVVGFSFQENLTRMVNCSKRILFCLTNDWDSSSESFIVSWNIAQEKIKETRSNFGIVVTHEIPRNQIKDKDLLRFIKGKRNIDTKESLFTKRLLYYMPSETRVAKPRTTKVAYDNQLSVIELENGAVQKGNPYIYESEMSLDKCHVFISYHDDEIDYVTKELQPLLEQNGYNLCIPDRDFLIGASKENNILNGIQACLRTILVLSKAHIRDEWSLFTFRNAYEKSMRQKNNHLVMILLDDVEDEILDEEVRAYLNHYITLKIDDRWFQQKLFNSLPLLRHKEYLHTSPLYFVHNADEDIEQIDVGF